MTQVAATTTNLLQTVPGDARTDPAVSENLFIKQEGNGRRAAFGQYLAGQLNQPANSQPTADATAGDANAPEDGKLLPDNGNISPLLAQWPGRVLASGHRGTAQAPVVGDALVSPGEDAQATPLLGLTMFLNSEPPGQGALVSNPESGQTLSVSAQLFQTGISHSASIRVVDHQGQGDTQLAIGNQQSPDRQQVERQLLAAADLDSDSAAQLTQADLKRLFPADYGAEGVKMIRQYSQYGHFASLHGQANIEQRLLNRHSDSRYQPTTDLIESADGYTTGLPQSVQGADGRPAPVFQLNQPVTNQQWTNEFSDRVRWLVSGNIKKAELSLTPKHLGTIDISISVHNDQTHISFNTQNHHSRDLVEASLGRLREMFDQAGLGNVNVDVSQHSDHRETASQGAVPDNNLNQGQADDNLVSTITEGRAGNNAPTTLIDLYA